MDIDKKYYENAKNMFFTDTMYYGYMKLYSSLKNIHNSGELRIVDTETVLKDMNRFISFDVATNIDNQMFLTNVLASKLTLDNLVRYEVLYTLLLELKYYFGTQKSIFGEEYFFHSACKFDEKFDRNKIDYNDNIFNNLLRFIISDREIFYRYCSYVFLFKIFFIDQDSVINGYNFGYEEIIEEINTLLIQNEINKNYSEMYVDDSKDDVMKPFFFEKKYIQNEISDIDYINKNYKTNKKNLKKLFCILDETLQTKADLLFEDTLKDVDNIYGKTIVKKIMDWNE